MNIFKKFKLFLTFREAVKMANQAYKDCNQRFYIVTTPDNRLVIMNRRQFRILRRKDYIAKDERITDLAYKSIYHTPDGSGRGGISAECLRSRFHVYLDVVREHEQMVKLLKKTKK